MRTFTLGLILVAGTTGCVHFQPIGPLADALPGTVPPAPTALADDAPVPEPIVRPAPRPTPPTVYVTPAEVTPLNAEEALKRLGQELDADRRAMEAMPSITEVSILKR
jgi:hypothetical protein